MGLRRTVGRKRAAPFFLRKEKKKAARVGERSPMAGQRCPASEGCKGVVLCPRTGLGDLMREVPLKPKRDNDRVRLSREGVRMQDLAQKQIS